MAKKSSIEKNNRRRKMAKKFASRRAKLKAVVQDKDLPMEERFAAGLKLAELPRNSARVRIRNLPGTPYLRASVGAWNDESDLDRLLAAL